MLALVSALVLLSPDARAEQYLKKFHVFCPPGIACHGPKAMLPVRSPYGRYFAFQEGPTSPVVQVYAGPIPSRVGQVVQVKKR